MKYTYNFLLVAKMYNFPKVNKSIENIFMKTFLFSVILIGLVFASIELKLFQLWDHILTDDGDGMEWDSNNGKG